MPRTGPASELIKQVMGLLMLAAAAYFVGVGVSGALVSPPDPPSRAYWWFVGLLRRRGGRRGSPIARCGITRLDGAAYRLRWPRRR